jgi:hypothetical protein
VLACVHVTKDNALEPGCFILHVPSTRLATKSEFSLEFPLS